MSEQTELASVSAERAILLENSAFYEASQDLRTDEFSLDSHRRIYACISRLMNRGSAADTTTVPDELRTTGELDTVGGIAYVWELSERVPRNLSISSYVRIVKEMATLREMRELGQTLTSVTREAGRTSEDLIDCTESRLLEIRAGRNTTLCKGTGDEVDVLLKRMWEEKNRDGDLLGLPSGIRDLDLMTRGYQPGEITIVGAKLGVGKTSLLIQSAIANTSQGDPVLLFSLEMTQQQILWRILCAVSGVSFPRVRDPRWASEQGMQLLTKASIEIKKWPLHIVDSAGITIEKITATARLAIRRHGVKLIGVDYCQIVNAPGKDERLRVSAISRGLTRLAKDEQVPVVVLSQLARPDRSNANRRPTMSDLRESSQLENDAHCIVLAHREWDEEVGKLKSEGQLIVAKQRSGETGGLSHRLRPPHSNLWQNSGACKSAHGKGVLMSHCPQGAELYRSISEGAHAPQRSMRERHETTYQTLEAYATHVRNCRTCRGLPDCEEDAALNHVHHQPFLERRVDDKTLKICQIGISRQVRGRAHALKGVSTASLSRMEPTGCTIMQRRERSTVPTKRWATLLQTTEISLVAGLPAPKRVKLKPLEFPQHAGVSNQYARARAPKTAGLYGRRR
jgi:replicative DNA helicase